MLAEAGTMVIIQSETSPVKTWAERPQEEAITLKATLKSQFEVCKCSQGQGPYFFLQFDKTIIELFDYNDNCYI